MKRYLNRLLLICSILVGLLLILALSRAMIIRNHSWRLSEKVHIVFMGASHVNRAIDDSQMETAVNWSRPSERYMFTYIKLQHLLPANPQVDTIFLELAPTDLWEDTDYKYHDLNEQAGYVKVYWPYLTIENWKIYMSEPFQVLGQVIGSLSDTEDLKQTTWWKHMGGYQGLETVMDTTEVFPQLETSKGYGRSVNYTYLEKIIDLCNEKKIKLIFIETPTWHPEYYYDQKYYYAAIKHYFSEIEFADYSKWPASLDEYYDAHHLNKKGAARFSQEIKEKYSIQ